MTDLEQIARLRPDVDDPSPEWLAATRTALLERRSWEPLRSRRSILVAAAAVVAVLAIVVPASSALKAPAHVTAVPDQYTYVQQGFSYDNWWVTYTYEDWFRNDSGEPVDSGPDCRMGPGVVPARCHTGPHSELMWAGQSLGELSVDQFRALPTDTAQLRAKIYDMARQWLAKVSPGLADGADQMAYRTICLSLLTGRAPQPLVEAFYRVLPTIPGVQTVPHVSDGARRPGVGFTRLDSWGRLTPVFDAASHRFMALNLDKDQPAGGLKSIVLLGSGPVAKVGDRP
jgi:hypothetical protein